MHTSKRRRINENISEKVTIYIDCFGEDGCNNVYRIQIIIYKTQLANGGKAMWGTKMIDNILTHPLYTGDMVQGRRRV
ncbi:recombinase family protein, partial [Christensenellaceae bacterium OttesenSCG-928-M15]|nr:recombinase family protein [Christensenellaceae bacterium OttesenSCG-928-M15]